MTIKVELLKDGRTAVSEAAPSACATFTLPPGEKVKIYQLRRQVESLGYEYLGYWVD